MSIFNICFGNREKGGPEGLEPKKEEPFATQVYQPNECINCTKKSFKGTLICETCHHPLRERIVDRDLIAAAVALMRDGKPSQAGKSSKDPKSDKEITGAVLLAYNDRCRQHRDEKTLGSFLGGSHPERPERAAAIMATLQKAGIVKRCLRTEGRDATHEELLAVHTKELVVAVERATKVAERALQQAQQSWYGPEAVSLERLQIMDNENVRDVYFNSSTAACARLAAGSAAEVARRVVAGAARHGAAIIRPPGHHAESSVAMGFCYYNNAAVAARAAQAAGARRVVIMDWDVHHGNGTQNIFYDDPSVLYMSTHRYDSGCFYPGSGSCKETGAGPGVGFTVNVPWNCPRLEGGAGDADMLAAFRHVIVPIAADFRPDLVIVSAGFDAVEGDPLGGCRVSPAAFSHFAAQLSALAPTVLLLEGGYNLTATAAATEGCMRVLLGEGPAPLGPGVPAAALAPLSETAEDPWVASGLEGVSDWALETLCEALKTQSQHWKVAREHLGLVWAARDQRLEKMEERVRQRRAQVEEEEKQRQAAREWHGEEQVPAVHPGQVEEVATAAGAGAAEGDAPKGP